MSMTVMLEEVKNLVKEEYGRASEKYGKKHASQNEAYAVIREEFQEAVEELNTVGELIEEQFWQNVRNDDVIANIDVAAEIFTKAVYAACECIQTAAMAMKALQGYERKDQQL